MIEINKINLKPVETVYEIKSEYKVPSYEEFMKGYKADEKVNYDDLGSGSVGEVKGYGPCSSYKCNCLPGEAWTPLKISCPVPNCKADTNKTSTWYHMIDGKDMEISNKARIRCSDCFYVLHIKNWKFVCKDHGGTPETTNYKAFTTALTYSFNVETVHPQVMIELNGHLISRKNYWNQD